MDGGGTAIDSFTTDVAGPVLPNATGEVDVTGTSIYSDGTTLNTLTLNVQATLNTFLYGQGTNTNAAELGPLLDGELIIGATGLAPSKGNLSSSDGSITIANGPGTIDLTVSASDDAILTLTGDDAEAVSPSSGNIDVLGSTVANATNAKPLYVNGTPLSNQLEWEIQVAAAITGAPGDKLDAGIASFDDTAFTVDTDGYVELTGFPAFNWVVETGATRSLLVMQGVFGNRGTAQTFTLPTTAAVGDMICVVQMGAGNITIDYSTGESIQFGSTASTTTTGTIVSTNVGDSVCMVCNVANTSWFVINSVGNWTIS